LPSHTTNDTIPPTTVVASVLVKPMDKVPNCKHSTNQSRRSSGQPAMIHALFRELADAKIVIAS